MKKLKLFKKVILVVLSISFLGVGASSNVIIASAQEVIKEEQSISPRALIIDWRYKIVGEHMYRRLYNYTDGIWIGEWELC